jgi:hypothetical protein
VPSSGWSASVESTTDGAINSTGQAAGALLSIWFCPLVVPPGATHNGAGDRCYDEVSNCVIGPNRCDSSSCYENNATCASGVSAGQGMVVFCDQTQPPGAIPNGAGMLCYNESKYCLLGPNACGARPVADAVVLGGSRSGAAQFGGIAFNGSPVLIGNLTASGTVASAANASVGCVTAWLYSETAFAVGVVTACPANGSLSSGAVLGEALGSVVGAPVYSDANVLGVVDPDGLGYLYSVHAITAPGGYTAPAGSIVGSVTMYANGTVESMTYGSMSCQVDYVTCSSGQAGPSINNWFCETDCACLAGGAAQAPRTRTADSPPPPLALCAQIRRARCPTALGSCATCRQRLA